MGRSPTALTPLVLATLAMAGCGGGEGGTSITTSTGPASGEDARTAQEGGISINRLPPPQPGSKGAAPGVPTSREGDSSIQTYGLEASKGERSRATAIVKAYLAARAAGDWAKACAYLAAKPRAEYRRIAQGASCAKATESLTTASPATTAAEAEIEALSFRAGSRYAFLIYRRPGNLVYATGLARERGRWKVISATPARVE